MAFNRSVAPSASKAHPKYSLSIIQPFIRLCSTSLQIFVNTIRRNGHYKSLGRYKHGQKPEFHIYILTDLAPNYRSCPQNVWPTNYLGSKLPLKECPLTIGVPLFLSNTWKSMLHLRRTSPPIRTIGFSFAVVFDTFINKFCNRKYKTMKSFNNLEFSRKLWTVWLVEELHISASLFSPLNQLISRNNFHEIN